MAFSMTKPGFVTSVGFSSGNTNGSYGVAFAPQTSPVVAISAGQTVKESPVEIGAAVGVSVGGPKFGEPTLALSPYVGVGWGQNKFQYSAKVSVDATISPYQKVALGNTVEFGASASLKNNSSLSLALGASMAHFNGVSISPFVGFGFSATVQREPLA